MAAEGRFAKVGGKIGPQQISGEDIAPTFMLGRAAGGFLLSTGRCSAQEGWKRGLVRPSTDIAGCCPGVSALPGFELGRLASFPLSLSRLLLPNVPEGR